MANNPREANNNTSSPNQATWSTVACWKRNVGPISRPLGHRWDENGIQALATEKGNNLHPQMTRSLKGMPGGLMAAAT